MTEPLQAEELEALEKVARAAAAAGETWSGKIDPQQYPECDDADLPYVVSDAQGRCVAFLPEAYSDRYRPYEEDGQFIATFDPATVLRLIDQLKALRAEPGEAVAWVIERGGKFYGVRWTSHEIDRAVDPRLWEDNWSPDANVALRLSRREDAEALIRFAGWQSATATEHKWCDLPRPSPETDQLKDGREVDDEDEAYEIGKRDGYEEAIQDIDLLTGGDGEYRFCTDHDPERHTPDAEAMKARIVARLSPRSLEGVGKQGLSPSQSHPSGDAQERCHDAQHSGGEG